MNLSSNTVLITGGSNGIGLALAQRFLQAGSEVIICGRREDQLLAVKKQHPQIHIRVCAVSSETERIALANWVTTEFPNLNVLINNAGIQHLFNFTQNPAWETVEPEIAINFNAPIHLT